VAAARDFVATTELLLELVEHLAGRLRRSDQALTSERHAARSLRATLEVLQGQNICLQQQLAWATQHWQYAVASAGEAEGGIVAVQATGAAGPGAGAAAQALYWSVWRNVDFCCASFTSTATTLGGGEAEEEEDCM